jgi:hypothetical protein
MSGERTVRGPMIILTNFQIQLPGRVRLFHANWLKQYHKRLHISEVVEALGAAVIEYDGEEEDDLLVSFTSNQTETYKDVQSNPDLSPENGENLKFKDVFTDVPEVTNLGEHCILLTSVTSVRSKAYPVPYAMKGALDKEIDLMLSLGVIEPSTAAYASPLLMVNKN